MRAAVLYATEEPRLDIRDDVEVIGPGAGEVLVRLRAAGVCHSDVSTRNGYLPGVMPAILGHEAAGEILAIGEGVTDLVPGDHVIACWMPPCGSCVSCLRSEPHLCIMHVVNGYLHPRFMAGDTPVFGMDGLGAFAEQMVVPRAGVVKIDKDVPFDVAALIGCGVTTGVGAVINTAKVRPGATVVVVGCGGVGISVIQGARLSGASTIIAVDVNEEKQKAARRFGATHSLHPDDLPGLQLELTNGEGFDYGFEVVGQPQTIRTTWRATRRGGLMTVVGAGRVDQLVEFSPFELVFDAKTITGSVYGGADVRIDFHRMISLWRSGHLDIEGMITHRIGLDDVNDALAAVGQGDVIRQVINYD